MFEKKSRRRVMSLGPALLVGGMLSGCSQIPDAINPVEWYNSSVEFFAGDEEKPKAEAKQPENTLAQDRGKAPPGDDKKFPKLTSVDQQRDYYEARKRGGLVADTEGRKYAPAIARQGEPSSQLAAAPPQAPNVTSQQPAPPAMPAGAVTTQQASLAPTTSTKLPSSSEQKAFQMRLQKRLNEIRARAGQPPAELPTSTAGIMAPDNFGTIVVNSTGISSGQTLAAAPNPAAVSAKNLAGGSLTHMARPARPIAGGAVKVATIHFQNGSAALSSQDRQIIANALQLKKERGGRIHIVGHASSRTRLTDPVRHKMVNFKVSVDRADAIARELMRLGVKKEELVVDAISDAQPVYYEFMSTGEAGNRRAEIYLES